MNLKHQLIDFVEFLNSLEEVDSSEFDEVAGFPLLPGEIGLKFTSLDNQELFAIKRPDGSYRTVIENTEPAGYPIEVMAELFIWSLNS